MSEWRSPLTGSTREEIDARRAEFRERVAFCTKWIIYHREWLEALDES